MSNTHLPTALALVCGEPERRAPVLSGYMRVFVRASTKRKLQWDEDLPPAISVLDSLRAAVGGLTYLARLANVNVEEWERWDAQARAAISAAEKQPTYGILHRGPGGEFRLRLPEDIMAIYELPQGEHLLGLKPR
jgi:hypothetical protein